MSLTSELENLRPLISFFNETRMPIYAMSMSAYYYYQSLTYSLGPVRFDMVQSEDDTKTSNHQN